jgi:Capsule assembly protein Wzi
LHISRPFLGASLLTAALAVGGVRPANAQALPFLAPGDAGLRHEVQLDADNGEIPLTTTWPVPTFDVPADQRDALRNHNQPGSGTDAGWFMTAARDPTKIRTFTDTARNNSAGVQAGWAASDYAGGAIRLSYNTNSADGMKIQLDGTYAAWRFGNWWVTAGQQDRWWGPGWDSSLILSSNARPMPGIGLERASSQVESWKGFRWLGPWHLVTFLNHMENHRADFNNTLFGGMRFTFAPVHGVEIGLSRTAEFCGQGHRCGPSTLFDVLIAKSNRRVNPIVDNDPSQAALLAQKQSAQFIATDVRWHIGDSPIALYWQQLGMVFDDKNLRPRQTLQLAGLEFASRSILDGRFRGFIELTDTACGDVSFSKTDQAAYGCAYEKDTWRAGYRYRGRPIGDSMDRDGVRVTLGGLYTDTQARNWELRLRHLQLNRGNIAQVGLVPDPVSLVAARLWNAEFDVAGDYKGFRYAIGVGGDHGGPVTERAQFTARAFVNLSHAWE